MSKKKTTEETIADFRKVHGDLYDYSKVDYVNIQTKVLIICQDHGEFLQTPNNHKRGIGCSECAGNKALTTEEVIADFRKVHGDCYDYSKTDYINRKTKVVIICPEHGEFLQKPINHKRGQGCRRCVDNDRALTTEEVITDFRKVHGYYYNYSKIHYVNCRTKAAIICPEHGEFWQRPDSHKRGIGCPECGKDQIAEPLFREVLEEIVSKFGDFEFPNIRPDWLISPETDKKLELDCYNEELELAFELQGTHHYEPIKAWGGEARFAKIIRRDSHKLTECRKRGVQLFRIDNRPVSRKTLQVKREYYENEIRKCLTKLPEKVKLKLVNANNKETSNGYKEDT